ncbi:heavy-metal-associated domain-containing protein [Micromonospora sp. NPDC049051]|uniref:heavy-metal-associated domain-containing protein n=1 Tax=unclassified Micromonospora TaxID=2617518 RepID=UPI0037237164
MITTTYQVQGMTCGHCASAVSKEVGAIQGVSDVQVDVAAGRVTVTSEGPLETDTVRSAVDEAGYDLVGA